MVLTRAYSVAAVLALLAGVPVALADTTFNTGLSTGGNWQTLYAQGFSPSVSPSPNPGVAAGSTVSLTQFQFFKSGTADSAANIRLAILNNLFANLTGLTTASGSFVGLSTNTVASTGGLATGVPITFNFSNLPLVFGNNYAAVYVNVGADQGGGVFPLTPVLVSSLAADYIETPAGSGSFHPTPNYGTESQFQYSTSNFISGTGFFNSFSFAGDAVFQATLTAPSVVPEPGTLAVVGVVGVALLARRRRVVR